MRAAERFFVMLVLTAVVTVIYDRAEGLPVCLFAFPALAVFYLFFTFSLLKKNSMIASADEPINRRWVTALSITLGIVLAYSALVICSYLFGWLSRAALLIRAVIPIMTLIFLVILKRHHTGRIYYNALLWRLYAASLMIGIITLIPFYHHGVVH